LFCIAVHSQLLQKQQQHDDLAAGTASASSPTTTAKTSPHGLRPADDDVGDEEAGRPCHGVRLSKGGMMM